MKRFTEYVQLDEKQIQFQQGKKYGQIVFLAGGAASGKGFALENFMQPERFKVRDVDEWKKALMKLDGIAKDVDTKYKQKGIDTKKKFGIHASELNLKNEEDVFRLHDMVQQLGWKEKTLELLLGGATNKDRLPNILFDITLKNSKQLGIIPRLVEMGYKSENIHLVWVLANFTLAMERNATRPRKVPEFKVIETHTGAARTMMGIIKGAIPRQLNGRVTVVLNNNDQTVFWKNADGKNTKLVKGFTSVDVKREGRKYIKDAQVEGEIYDWVKSNAPAEAIHGIDHKE